MAARANLPEDATTTADASVTAAEVLASPGNRHEAARAAKEALDLYEAKGNVVAATLDQGLLSQVAG